MRWQFWKKTPSVEESTETIEVVETAEVDANSPQVSDFTFDISAAQLATAQQTAIEEPPATMADIVRSKAAGRGANRAPRMGERGVAPMLVPSLRTMAQRYRLEAERADNPANALAWWRAYLELVDDDLDALFTCGQVLLELGNFEDAESVFLHIHALEPTHGLAAGALGFLSAKRGGWRDACRYYEVAVSASPDTPGLAMALADAQRRSKEGT